MFRKFLKFLKEILQTEININPPEESKEDKRRASVIKDSLRLLCWQEIRKESDEITMESYQSFAEQWNNCGIQSLSLKSVLKLIEKAEYTEEDLITLREQHYYRR